MARKTPIHPIQFRASVNVFNETFQGSVKTKTDNITSIFQWHRHKKSSKTNKSRTKTYH